MLANVSLTTPIERTQSNLHSWIYTFSLQLLGPSTGYWALPLDIGPIMEEGSSLGAVIRETWLKLLYLGSCQPQLQLASRIRSNWSSDLHMHLFKPLHHPGQRSIAIYKMGMLMIVIWPKGYTAHELHLMNYNVISIYVNDLYHFIMIALISLVDYDCVVISAHKFWSLRFCVVWFIKLRMVWNWD